MIRPDACDRALGQTSLRTIAAKLRSDGLAFDLGAATLHVRSDVAALAEQLQAVYGAFPFRGPHWADMHVDLVRPAGPRRWFRPQVKFRCDGQEPFEAFASDTALPLLEWGVNWLIGRRLNDLLLLHAGVVERDGLALVMPAVPGSGKSTLTAGLSLRGWRLLSDEFGAFDLTVRAFRSVLKPVALKNDSIRVIREFSGSAPMGPEFPKTRKGTVAHLAPSADAVARVHEPARPGAIVLPRWQAGSATRWERLEERTAFTSLAFNAFNYAVCGAAGFEAVVQLVKTCPAWSLVYSDLEDAIESIQAAWPQVLDGIGSIERPSCHGSVWLPQSDS